MGKYDDIINVERPISKKHHPMPLENRAAQFAPFAALTGYDDAVKETARTTDEKIELSEEAGEEIDRKLSDIISDGIDKTKICVEYFIKDENIKKSGGRYEKKTGFLKALDYINEELVFTDGIRIKKKNVIDITNLREND